MGIFGITVTGGDVVVAAGSTGAAVVSATGGFVAIGA